MMLAKLVKTLLLCGLAVAAIMWLESISQPPVSAFFDSFAGYPNSASISVGRNSEGSRTD